MFDLDLHFRTDDDKRLFETGTFNNLKKSGFFEHIITINSLHYTSFVEYFHLQDIPAKDSYKYFSDCYICQGSIEECADFLIYLELVDTADIDKVINIIQNSNKFFYNKLSKVLYISPNFYNNIATSI
mgnify:FL=1